MLIFEVINELTLKVTCRGNDVLFTKAGILLSVVKNSGAEKIINLKSCCSDHSRVQGRHY